MYNCEQTIVKVIQQLSPEIQKHFAEVVFIDNCSQDNTVAAALDRAKSLTVPWKIIQNNHNYSLGGSHKIAFDYCLEKNYDYCVVFHGDNQGRITDLLPFFNPRQLDGSRQLLGSRFHRKSKLYNYSKIKIFGNLGLNLLLSLITRQWISDMGAGINCYSKEFLRKKYYKKCPDDLTFNISLLLLTINRHEQYTYFPIHWHEEGSVSNARLIQQTMLVLRYALGYFLSKPALYTTPGQQRYRYAVKYTH
jgi:glycosyltransferase involved in cell wall biosynthesis